jgi:hypothetical protein
MPVGGTDHHALDARRDDRIRARPGPTVARARLKRDIERRARSRCLAPGEQREAFGVRAAIGRRGPFGDDVPILDDQRADHRIGVRGPPDSPRHLERAAHEDLVFSR